MRWLALCIVGGGRCQNYIVNNVLVDDWMAELAIIASNGVFLKSGAEVSVNSANSAILANHRRRNWGPFQDPLF